MLEQTGANNSTVEENNNVTENMNPVVVDEFIGYDVVIDDDQTLEDLNNGNDLINFDTAIENRVAVLATAIENDVFNVVGVETASLEPMMHVAPMTLINPSPPVCLVPETTTH